MLTLHPEYLKKNGTPEFVVLPYAEFKEIEEWLEDQEDIHTYHEAKAEHNGGITKSLREVEEELSAN